MICSSCSTAAAWPVGLERTELCALSHPGPVSKRHCVEIRGRERLVPALAGLVSHTLGYLSKTQIQKVLKQLHAGEIEQMNKHEWVPCRRDVLCVDVEGTEATLIQVKTTLGTRSATAVRAVMGERVLQLDL